MVTWIERWNEHGGGSNKNFITQTESAGTINFIGLFVFLLVCHPCTHKSVLKTSDPCGLSNVVKVVMIFNDIMARFTISTHIFCDVYTFTHTHKSNVFAVVNFIIIEKLFHTWIVHTSLVSLFLLSIPLGEGGGLLSLSISISLIPSLFAMHSPICSLFSASLSKPITPSRLRKAKCRDSSKTHYMLCMCIMAHFRAYQFIWNKKTSKITIEYNKNA